MSRAVNVTVDSNLELIVKDEFTHELIDQSLLEEKHIKALVSLHRLLKESPDDEYGFHI